MRGHGDVGTQTWLLPDLCGGLVIARDGLVVAMRRDLARSDPRDGSLESLAEIEPASLDNRLNEMRCDPQGRIWVGSMRDIGTAVTGSLYRVDFDLTVNLVLRDICVPNCFAWRPEGHVMYFSDSPDCSVRAYDFDGDTGTLGAMRILHDD